MNLNSKEPKIYFLSDVHLGVPSAEHSLQREKKLVHFLDSIKAEATDIMILGDLFDMWFDYKRVVPRGFYRILAKLSELADLGIQIHFFKGNHDMWVFNHLKNEIPFTLYSKPEIFEIGSHKLMVGHGDGLGQGDNAYKLIKRIFEGPFNQWLFARLHPNFGIGLAMKLSARSRISNGNFEEKMGNPEEEILVRFCRSTLENQAIDYFVFGHRHIAITYPLNATSTYINLGEWVKKPHYALYEKGMLNLVEIS